MGVQIPPMKMGNFGERGVPLSSIGTLCVIRAKTAEPIEIPFGLWAGMGPRHHVLDGSPQVLSMGYNFGYMIASDTWFDYMGGFLGSSYPMKT